MKIAQTADSPGIIRTIDTDNREGSPIGSRAKKSNFKSNAPECTIIQQAFQQTIVLAVHFETTESRDSQNLCHTDLNESFLQNVQDWKKIMLCDKYLEYRDKFVVIFSKFQTMWDGTFVVQTSRTTVSKSFVTTCNPSTRHRIVWAQRRRSSKKSKLTRWLNKKS